MEGKKGDWVQVHKIVLNSENRAPQVPEDTKNVPLEQWVKGFLQEDASLGNKAIIQTITGRSEEGTLVQINPSYTHDFGNFIPEILKIGIQLKEILSRGESNE